jgi:hypothetical protein
MLNQFLEDNSGSFKEQMNTMFGIKGQVERDIFFIVVAEYGRQTDFRCFFG